MFTNKNGVFRAITPIAYGVLVDRFAEFSREFDIAATLVMKASLEDFTADAKGRTFERFVLHKWEQDKAIQTTAFIVNPATDPNLWERKEIDISGCNVVHFTGNKATKKVDWENPALIIPMSSNYPDVDAFFFNPVDGLFLACQFTVSNPFTKHSRNFFDIRDFNAEALWRNLSGDKIKTVRMLWVTTNKNAKDYKNDWVTTHMELGGRYPALQGFVLNK